MPGALQNIKMEDMKVHCDFERHIFNVAIKRIIFTNFQDCLSTSPILLLNSPPCHFNTSQPVIIWRHQTRSFNLKSGFEKSKQFNVLPWNQYSAVLAHSVRIKNWPESFSAASMWFSRNKNTSIVFLKAATCVQTWQTKIWTSLNSK